MIIPVYNVKDYLVDAIESLINQTIGFKNIQAIIVDDCSTDGSKEIIKEYEEKFDNIFAIYRKENSGGGAVPRNDGLKCAKADYIMFLDPDDYFSNDYCETLYDKIATDNVDLVKCNSIYIIDGNKKVLTPYFDSTIDEVMFNGADKPIIRSVVWCGIHKKEIIDKNKIDFPNIYPGEDIVFSMNQWVHIKDAIYLNNYFGYVHRELDDSHAKKPTLDKICSLLYSFELGIRIVRSHNREDIANWVVGDTILGAFPKLMENGDSLKSKKQVLKKINDLQKSLPNLIIPNSPYKIALMLTKYRLFYLTLLYLKILKFCKHSNIIKTFYRKVVLRHEYF